MNLCSIRFFLSDKIYHILSFKNERSQGSALVYILLAIALLAALTASFMKPSNQQQTAQSTFNTVSALKSQIDLIRSAIQSCILTHPDGDRGANGSSGLLQAAYDDLVKPYPIDPTSSYYDGPPDIKAANNQVRHIRCPGDPGNDYDHADMFGGTSGKFLQPPPNLFEEWEYHNGTDGVFFFTNTDKTDPFLQTAMQKLDDQFSECEVDIVTASGSDLELTSTAAASDPKCLDGQICVRVWMIINATAIYPGDSDGEEAAATCP